MSVALDDMSPYARSVVERLGLEPHPEGGWYVRDWQSPIADRSGDRPLSSLIYFLLAQGDASAWHKVDADEIWLWHGPAPVTIELGGDGDAPAAQGRTVTLGAGIATDDAQGPVGHLVIPAGVWQRTVPGRGDALVSCVVSPGFEFAGFTLQQTEQTDPVQPTDRTRPTA